MMLVRKIVESNRGLSNIVTSVIIIAIALVAVVILWSYTREIIEKSPVEQAVCLGIDSSFDVEKACYLNAGEIRVDVSRSIDDFSLSKIDFSFSPNSGEWVLEGDKCLDARILGKNYGDYCSLPLFGARLSYVFNVSGIEKENSLAISLFVNKVNCFLGRIDIDDSC